VLFRSLAKLKLNFGVGDGNLLLNGDVSAIEEVWMRSHNAPVLGE
jgi:hypothetical protein